ncbi:MAG: class I SAM-dependent methyltransferase [Candidatus Acidiferrales bacterium]
MTATDPEKLQNIRERLRHEWTDERTVAAWRKWRSHISHFTRGATEAILEAAKVRPGMQVLDLASGVGDPALFLAATVGPTGHVTATDIGPDMISLAEEMAQTKGLTNITFQIANAESLPFANESFDLVTCRFGVMLFPDQVAALKECRRVLKQGGRVALVAWGAKEQPFFTTTAGILLKYVPIPPPDPDAPHLFMFGERGRLRRTLEEAGFKDAHEEVRTIAGKWTSSLEKYWEQFTEVAAPFRPLIEKLTPETRAKAVEEILVALRKFSDGKELNMPLEIVVGTGTRK